MSKIHPIRREINIADIKIAHKIKAGANGAIDKADFSNVDFDAEINNGRINSAADLAGRNGSN